MTAVVVEKLHPSRTIAPAAPVPLTRLLKVEIRKMFDTRSGLWLMASVAITALIATASVILFGRHGDLTYATFGKAVGFPMAVVLPMIAILSVTSEWSQRSGLTTFALVPNRKRVILAKACAAVMVGAASMVVALAIGAVGALIGSAVNGTSPVWNVSVLDAVYIVLGNVLGLLTGFMLGAVLRSSTAAIVAYFVYSFVLGSAFALLAENQKWFHDARPWIDVNYAQSVLFQGPPSAQEWAHIGVTGLIWLVVPLTIGLRRLMRSEIK
jgi:ABC-type transport system involved in multi-copper enzyme maturation permease subunit